MVIYCAVCKKEIVVGILVSISGDFVCCDDCKEKYLENKNK